MKTLTVTDKQLEVIKDACELYGRIQIGQFGQFAEIVTQTGFSGSLLRVQPKKNKGESADQYKVRCNALEKKTALYATVLMACWMGFTDAHITTRENHEPTSQASLLTSGLFWTGGGKTVSIWGANRW